MDLERFRAEFARNFTERGDLGASVCVWQGGRELISLAGGWQDREQTKPWMEETPVLFWSATKGLAAAAFLHACEKQAIGLERRVAEFWPEFAQQGKGEVTLAELLSHRAGLCAIDGSPSILDHDAVASALAAQAPLWPLGSAHGYHARTLGFLIDEVLRRIAGVTLGEYFRAHFAEPLGLDLWIGLPEEKVDAVAPVFASRSAPPKGDVFYTAFLTSGSLTSRSFASPKGLHSASAMNTPEARRASLPASGGIGTARSLAKFYALLPKSPEMSRTLVNGPDLVLLTPTAFSAGFMQDPIDAAGRKLRTSFGPSTPAFGHPGAGGSVAFADPENGLSFAYVMNQMEPGALPGPRSQSLVDALYAT